MAVPVREALYTTGSTGLPLFLFRLLKGVFILSVYLNLTRQGNG
jgi:hypothetical protein